MAAAATAATAVTSATDPAPTAAAVATADAHSRHGRPLSSCAAAASLGGDQGLAEPSQLRMGRGHRCCHVALLREGGVCRRHCLVGAAGAPSGALPVD